MPLSDYFRKIEGLLYNYMRQQEKIEKLEVKRDKVEKEISKIIEEIKSSNFTIPEQSLSVNYSDVYTKMEPSSYMDRAVERYGDKIEKLQAQLLELWSEKIKTMLKIMNIKEGIANIDYGLTKLNNEERAFVDLKYKDGYSNYAIASKLYTSEASIRRKRTKVINKLADKLGYKTQERRNSDVAPS